MVDTIKQSSKIQTELADLGKRLAGLRDACGFLQDEFAGMLGISQQALAGYEETGFDIPISVLMHAARLCDVDMAVLLTGSSTHLHTYQVVRAGEGRVVDRFPGYHFEDLAYNYGGKVMQPLLVSLETTDEPAQLVTHGGQEFNYVVAGKVILVFEDKEIELDVGDSVYFNPQIPHGQRCGSSQSAVFVTIITD
ncbi:MAG: cupin domain-containing protein [Coriobacteriales bacterium]|jgi:quercetin dioxygenase-like cupin family protein/DNA-binding XRE family transcriptional regulator|nr:cupin domain-containing protein [Coriobacteriales bacterium]